MGLELRLVQRQALRLEQRQALKLDLKIAPPDGWSFKEPPPIKEIELYKGKPVVRIKKDELMSFAEAVKNILQLLQLIDSRVVLISMRGALPLFRCLLKAQNQANRLDESWTTRNFRRGFNFTAAKLYTSYFIDDLSTVVGEGLENAFETVGAKSDGSSLRVVLLDTSVTGTKLGWFMPQFIDAISQVAAQLEILIDLHNIVLNHAKHGIHTVEQASANGVTVKTHNFGVESLIAEDNPTLLGVNLRRVEEITCADGAIGEIRAYEDAVSAGILVDDRSYVSLVKPRYDEKTAALFARLVGNVARGT